MRILRKLVTIGLSVSLLASPWLAAPMAASAATYPGRVTAGPTIHEAREQNLYNSGPIEVNGMPGHFVQVRLDLLVGTNKCHVVLEFFKNSVVPGRTVMLKKVHTPWFNCDIRQRVQNAVEAAARVSARIGIVSVYGIVIDPTAICRYLGGFCYPEYQVYPYTGVL